MREERIPRANVKRFARLRAHEVIEKPRRNRLVMRLSSSP
jgi:hypothetical protein